MFFLIFFLLRKKAAKVKTNDTIQKELDKNVHLISEPELKEKVKLNLKTKKIAKEKNKERMMTRASKNKMEMEVE